MTPLMTPLMTPSRDTIPAVLKRHARERPSAPALRGLDGSPVTYGELYERALAVAARMAAIVGPTDRVVVPMENTPDSVVTVLAVMWAAVAVPVSPAATRTQLENLVTVTGAALTVSSPADLQAVAGDSIPAPAGDRLALLLETSGSSSAPRMVMLTHAQWLDGARRVVAHLGLGPDDRTLNLMPLFHNHGLNGAVLASLVAGGEVTCPGTVDMARLPVWLADSRPTWLTASPAVHAAVHDSAAACLATLPLRVIRSTSAPLPAELARRLNEASGAPVVQAYALTETSGQVAATPMDMAWPHNGTVGSALHGFEVAALDQAGRRCLPGIQGELAVRGGTVSTGYLGETGPMADPGGWLRTGDLGTVDAAGRIHLTGRGSDRLNRGGEKVWLPDIDEACLSHPAVGSAMAFGVAHPRLGEDIAVAVVPAAGHALDPLELRHYLRAKLPVHLVPRTVELVGELPVGPAGKPQRWLLRERFSAAGTGRTAGGPRRSAVAAALASLWCEVLEVEEIDDDEDFLSAGGDSLLATKLLAGVTRVFAVELPMATVYGDDSTVAGMAALIASEIEKTRRGDTALAIRRDDDGPVPLSPAQARLWVLHELFPQTSAYHVPLAFHLRGEVDPEALEQAVTRLVSRHDALRTRIEVQEGVPSQASTSGSGIWLRIRDVDGGYEAALELATADARRPFDLCRGPLARVLLVRFGAAESLLVLTMHHLITDSWSNEILVRDLTALYREARGGGDANLPSLPVRYADFARWQHTQMTDAIRSREVDWWGRRLRDLPPPLPLRKADGERDLPDLRGGALPFTVPAEVAEDLRAIARQEATTLFAVLLAACQGLLARMTKATDIVVATPVSGRLRPEAADVVGLFVNTLPMRVDCSGDPSFRELVRRAWAWAREAYDHQALPFEQVVKAVLPDRGLEVNPLTQVFMQVEKEDGVTGFEGVGARRLTNLEGGARGDLELHFHDAPGALPSELVYATQVMGADAAEALAVELKHFLEQVGRRPDLRLSEIKETGVMPL